MWRTGPQPRSEVTPSPAQAGCAALGTCVGDRAVSWLCLRAVLVAGFDERHPVQILFESSRKLDESRSGSGLPALCLDGDKDAGSWSRGGDIAVPVPGCQ